MNSKPHDNTVEPSPSTLDERLAGSTNVDKGNAPEGGEAGADNTATVEDNDSIGPMLPPTDRAQLKPVRTEEQAKKEIKEIILGQEHLLREHVAVATKKLQELNEALDDKPALLAEIRELLWSSADIIVHSMGQANEVAHRLADVSDLLGLPSEVPVHRAQAREDERQATRTLGEQIARRRVRIRRN